MEEKKRKKSKKKNRSAQSQTALSHPETSEAPNSNSPDHIQCSNQNVDIQANSVSLVNGNSRGKVEVVLADDGTEQTQVLGSEESSSLQTSDPPLNADGNVQQETGYEDGPEFSMNFANVARDQAGLLPDRVCNQTQTETHLLDEKEAHLRQELTTKEQLVYELREALATKTESTGALRAVLDELKTAHDIFEAGSQQQIQQLRAEIVQFREMESYHLKQEADLQGELRYLKEEIAQLRETQDIQLQNERVAKHAETQQLEEENIHQRGEIVRLSKEVEEMRDLIERLLLERQQLTANMVAVQTGAHQLEYEGAAHAHFDNEVAVVTAPESLKQWVATEDPVAEATTAAEESHRQLAAAAIMVERLVTENSELVEKVNEQNALIDRLAQKYSSVMEIQSNGFLENTASEQKLSTFTQIMEADREHSGAQAVYVVPSPGSKVISTLDEEDIEAQRTVVPSLVTVSSTSNAVLPVEFDRLSQEVSEEIIDDAMTGIASRGNLQEVALMKPNELKPFSDAPILGAPIRLFNFITKYVSGADLMKIENPK